MGVAVTEGGEDASADFCKALTFDTVPARYHPTIGFPDAITIPKPEGGNLFIVIKAYISTEGVKAAAGIKVVLTNHIDRVLLRADRNILGEPLLTVFPATHPLYKNNKSDFVSNILSTHGNSATEGAWGKLVGKGGVVLSTVTLLDLFQKKEEILERIKIASCLMKRVIDTFPSEVKTELQKRRKKMTNPPDSYDNDY